MPRDTLTNVSDLVGAPLTVNPGAKGNFGDVIIHQGVPHVAWCETVGSVVPVTLYGPYVAKWTGSAWSLLTPDGALPLAIDPGDVALWQDADLATTCPAVERFQPKLATDGVHLYLGIDAAIMQRLVIFALFGLYAYYRKIVVYGFRLDGSSWTTLGDPVYGMFPTTIGNSGEFYSTDISISQYTWDISASPAAPGNCYFAFSDYGTNIYPAIEAGFETFNHLVVVGTDLAEQFVDPGFPGGNAPSTVSPDPNVGASKVVLDGGGDTLALYHAPESALTPGVYDTEKILVWTRTGPVGEINSSSFGIPFILDIQIDSAATWNGIRYLLFEADRPGISLIVVQRILDLASPAAVSHLDPANSTPFSPPLFDLDIVEGGASGLGGFRADELIAEPGGLWVALSSSPDIGNKSWVAHLDLRCPTRTPWDLWHVPLSDFQSGRYILYGDELWWYTRIAFNDDGNPLIGPTEQNRFPQVWKTPICRGCVKCPPRGLHVWNRF